MKCETCKSENVTRQGFRKTHNRGKIQKWYCQDCKTYFTQNDGFLRMRHNPEDITRAIDLYFSNLSSRKVKSHYQRHQDLSVSHITVLSWCRKYVLKAQRYIDTLNPSLSGCYYADETEIRRKRDNDIFWCSIDWETRYINATHYSSLSQNNIDARKFMENIKKSGVPKYIQTDALPFYPRAFRKTFYNNRRKNLPQHRVLNHSKTGLHNVRIETVFMKINDRVDDFRTLKQLWSSPILMNGIVIQHNYIEPHTSTGVVPCELAGIHLPNENNRWLSLIQKSAEVFLK